MDKLKVFLCAAFLLLNAADSLEDNEILLSRVKNSHLFRNKFDYDRRNPRWFSQTPSLNALNLEESNESNESREQISLPADSNTEASPYNDISERCIQNSITPVQCPEQLPDDRLLPHPDDCQLFYYCVASNLPPICRDCPSGLHFNPNKNVCDHPAVAGCQTSAINPPPAQVNVSIKSSNDIIDCNGHNGVYADLRPHPTYCSRYYVCDWGTPILMNCPEGLHFNPTLLICDNPENARCEVNVTVDIIEPTTQFFDV